MNWALKRVKDRPADKAPDSTGSKSTSPSGDAGPVRVPRQVVKKLAGLRQQVQLIAFSVDGRLTSCLE